MPRRRSAHDPIEGDFTSMLDVIFNLLAFFVITFNPPKPELNFDLMLPPPKKIETQAKSTEDMFAPKEEIFKDVTIRLTSAPDGNVAGIFVEGQKVDGIKGMIAKVQKIGGAIGGTVAPGAKGDTGALEAANIIADPELKYVHVIEAVDACYQLNIVKINFGGTEKTRKAGGPK